MLEFQAQIDQISVKFKNNIDLTLQIHHIKLVRDKGKVRDQIERYILSEHDFKKPYAGGYDYEITVPFENDEDLDETIDDMLGEMNRTADYRNCFVGADVHTLDGEKFW